jgi:PAS domain S-box-containing protein
MPSDLVRLKLLLVEDSEDDAELVYSALFSSGFQVSKSRVVNGEEMKIALERESWDAVLSDYNLPEFSTSEALEILKLEHLDIPFIVVSGCIGEETAVALMKSGAHDFVMKDNLARLGPALKRELRESEIRRERLRMEVDIKRWADVFRRAHWGVAIESADGKVFENINPEFARMYGYKVEEMEGSHISDFSFPPDCCQIPAVRPEGCVWEATHVRKDGSTFPVLINVSEVLEETGKTAYRVVNVQDITRIKETERALQKSEARFEAMTNNIPVMVFQYLAEGLSGRFTFVSGGATEICGLTPEILQNDPSAFIELLAKEENASFFEARGASERNISAWNWEGEIRLSEGKGKWVNLRAIPQPLEGGGMLWDGVLLDITESKQKEAEIRNSRELLRQLSAHRDSVKEDERKRIAREIHDELGQSLTALKIDVDWLEERISHEGRVGERLQSMSRILLETVESVRRIARNLRPGMLDDLGLAAAIEWLVDQFMERSDIDCRLVMNREEFEVDESLAICIYRILQEALTNIARHSGADSVRVTLNESEDIICLEVHDNGSGFDTDSRMHSFGLLGIKERAEMLGGKVEISSAQGSGTSVRVTLPKVTLQ